jgi:hypothetical protein
MQKKSLFLASLLFGLTLSSCVKKETIDDPTTNPDINTFTVDFELAYTKAGTPNAKCFIDFDKGIAYTIQDAVSHASEIDAVWHWRGQSYYDMAVPYNNGSDDFYWLLDSAGFEGADLFAGWSVRNNGKLDRQSDLIKKQITDLTTNAALTTLYNNSLVSGSNDDFDGLSATLDKPYAFETGAQKKGFFIVNSVTTNSNGGRANITIKIQK